MYKDTWILVANKSKARFLVATSNQDLEEKESLFHPSSRMKGIDLVSDRPGRVHEGNKHGQGVSRHGVSEGKDIKEEEAIEFAREISSKLDELIHSGEMKQLIIATNPEFLGILRHHMSAAVSSMIKETVNKEITDLPPQKIRDFLPYVL